MFGFGQIVHFLPYIILAITSFVGLTGYTLNYAQQKSESILTSDKEILAEQSTESEAQEVATFYQSTNKFSPNKTTSATYCVTTVLSSVKKTLPPNSGSLYFSDYNSHLQQRPPPCYYLA